MSETLTIPAGGICRYCRAEVTYDRGDLALSDRRGQAQCHDRSTSDDDEPLPHVVAELLILARAETGRYTFEVLATTEEQANDLLLGAYAVHAACNPYADPDHMRDIVTVEDVNYYPIRVGAVLRDGSPIGHL